MKFLFSIIATLLLATVSTTTAQKYTGGYMGVFYNLTVKAELRDTFLSYDILGTADNSSKVGSYDHTTIYFEPTQTELNVYNPRLGVKQSAHILGYAMDEHGQALLLSYDGPNAIQTANAFPHVTISSSNYLGIYTAVYSNDLWARVASSGFVNITNDAYGKPASIQWNLTAITDSSLIVNGTYNFTLGEFTSTTNLVKGVYPKYTPTLVRVTLFEPTIDGLEGIFCASGQWNRTSGVCNTTPLILPTQTPTTATPTTATPTATPTPTVGPTNNSTNSSSSSSSSSSTGVAPTNAPGSSTGSSASMITSSFTMISTGIVSVVIALLFL